MKVPVKNKVKKCSKNTTKKKQKVEENSLQKHLPKFNVTKEKRKRKHPQYGTSKLEEDFARDFLDKLKVKYVYQYEAKSIGRFFDFYLMEHNLLIEIDGSYFHGDPRLYKEEELSRMQLKNQRVDEYKNQWAAANCIPIMRIWEYDIRKNPNLVMDMLKKRLNIESTKQILKENKNKRHVNKL